MNRLIQILVILPLIASAVSAQPRFGKNQQHIQTVYKDEATTFTMLVTLNGGSQYGTFTPTVNGQVGWDGSSFLFRQGGQNLTLSDAGLPGTINTGEIAIGVSSNTLGAADGASYDNSQNRLTLENLSIFSQGSTPDLTIPVNWQLNIHSNSANNNTGFVYSCSAPGNGSGRPIAYLITMQDYTGGGQNSAVWAINSNNTTGTSIASGSVNLGDCNTAIQGNSDSPAAGTGAHIGMVGAARLGAVNIGLFGKAIDSEDNSDCVGVLGVGSSTGTGGIAAGGFFALSLSDTNPINDTFALGCDNGPLAVDIFQARDNGTLKMRILNGGVAQFEEDIYLDGSATRLSKDGSNNLALTDANAGTKTLTQLANSKETVQLTVGSSAFVTYSPPAALSVVEGQTNNVSYSAYSFDDTTDEFVGFQVVTPSELVTTGNLVVRMYWTPETPAANGVRWVVSALAIADGETYDAAMTSAGVTDTGSASSKIIQKAEITQTAATWNVGAGELVTISIARDPDHAGDTLVGDAHLIGVSVTWEVGS